jgi:hypothetical protein
MKLSDFATLADAQVYPLVTDKKQVGSGQARGFFVNNSIWTTLRQLQSDMTNPLFALADAVIVTASDASSYFGLDVTTAEGVGNIAAAQMMVDVGIMTDAQKTALLDRALKTTYPFKDSTQEEFDEAKDPGETISLAQNNSQHVAKINITTAPLKPTDIIVQQKFGPDNTNLTEWHDIGAFRQVQYTQRSYETMIAASPAAYRELRAVSPLTLGLSIV